MKIRPITLILLAFILLGLAYSVANPLHEATDELRHYRFVRFIAANQRLPVQGQEPCRSQSHHPPLFYALAALATGWIDTGRDICHTPPQNPFWAYRYFDVGVDNKNQFLHGPEEAFPWSGEALVVHIIRALNVLIGTGTVWLTWAIGRSIWPTQPALALGGAAFIAFNPMFLYMAGAINNDIIAAFSGAAVLLSCVRLLRDPSGLERWQWGIILGALYSLALLSKFNLAALAILIEIAVTLVAWRKKQWRGWLLVNLLIAITTIAIAGWWFLRNWLLYGEPTGLQILTELWGVRDPTRSFDLALMELPYAWSSLWGRFGFGQIPLPQVIYDALAWLTLFAFAGLALPLINQWRAGNGPGHPQGAALQGRAWTAEAAKTTNGHLVTLSSCHLVILLLDILLFAAVLFNYMLISPAGPMGRFFFPALPALSLLMFYGLSRWVVVVIPKPLSAGRRRRSSSSIVHSRITHHASRFTNDGLQITAYVASAAMLTLALVALFGYLAPAYARPDSWPASAALPNPTEAHFDSLAVLRGYEVNPTTIQPGQLLDVTLYWEVSAQPPGDYWLFVHLVDSSGTIVAQRDTHPGLGRFPSSQWRPGDRFVERVRLYLPETAYTPATAHLDVGLYAPGAYRLAVNDGAGNGLGDALTLIDNIQIEPWQNPRDADWTPPNPLDQNFNDEMRLAGYQYSERRLQPGDDLTVTLYWEALQDQATDYVVELRLVDEEGREHAQADSSLWSRGRPAEAWRAGQQAMQYHTLHLPETLPPGSYVVRVALYDADREESLNIVAEDGHWIDDVLALARIRVEP